MASTPQSSICSWDFPLYTNQLSGYPIDTETPVYHDPQRPGLPQQLHFGWQRRTQTLDELALGVPEEAPGERYTCGKKNKKLRWIYGGFLKWGYPNSWLVYVRENPIQVNDDWGVPLFQETSILGNTHNENQQISDSFLLFIFLGSVLPCFTS